MATVEFNIQKLYGSVRWNLPFPALINGDVTRLVPKLFNPSFNKKTPSENLQNPSASNYAGEAVLSDLSIADFDFVIPPVITIKNTKRIVQTAVAGMEGSVKEIIGMEDWTVNLKCFITNTRQYDESDVAFSDIEGKTNVKFKSFKIRNDAFPENELRAVRDLYEKNQALRVISPFLNLFNIQYLVLTSFDIPETEGYYNMIPLEINAVSDKPLDVRLRL